MKNTIAVTIRVPSENMEYTALCPSISGAVKLIQTVTRRTYESALEFIAISFMLKHDKLYTICGCHVVTIELEHI